MQLVTYRLRASTTQSFLFTYAIFALLFCSALAGPLAFIEDTGLTPPTTLCSKETSKSSSRIQFIHLAESKKGLIANA